MSAVTPCAACGSSLFGAEAERGVCGHHHAVAVEGWAVANRVFCDWLHRRIEPPHVPWVEAPPVEWSDVA